MAAERENVTPRHAVAVIGTALGPRTVTHRDCLSHQFWLGSDPSHEGGSWRPFWSPP
jgi:hypothetical protein